MESQKEKLDYCEVIKNPSKNFGELIWQLFVFYQWAIIICVPIGVLISIILIILPNTDFAPNITLNGEQLYSLKARIICITGLFVYVCFAFYYFFKIRKLPEFRTRTKFFIVSIYVGIMFILSTMVELAEEQYIRNNLYYSKTTVCLYDAETRELLLNNISCSGFVRSSEKLPIQGCTSLIPKKGFCLETIDIVPKEVVFSAPGYESRKVLVGTEEGEQTIVVYLEKEEFIEPNAY